MKKLIFDLKILFIPCEENNYRPHFLKSKFLLYYVVVLVVLNILVALFFVSLPKTVFFADVARSALFSLTNQEREASGLSSLQESTKLNEVAQQKANDMLANDYFAHYSPTGISPWHWFKNVGYGYQAAGENLAIGFADSEELVDAWIDSPSHRANILNTHFQETGIAVLTGQFNGSETTVVVQVFGSPVSSKVNTVVEETTAPEEVAVDIIEQPSTPTVAAAVQFMTVDYFNIARKILCASLALIILALILDIFIKIKIQDKSLILKSVLLIVLLLLLVYLVDKQIILQLIPHNLQI